MIFDRVWVAGQEWRAVQGFVKRVGGSREGGGGRRWGEVDGGKRRKEVSLGPSICIGLACVCVFLVGTKEGRLDLSVLGVWGFFFLLSSIGGLYSFP